MTYVAYGFEGSLEKFNSIKEQTNFGDKDIMYILGDLACGEGAAELICELSMMMNVYPIFGKKDFLALKLLSGFDKMLREGMTPDAEYIEQMKFWAANGGQAVLDGFRGLDEDMREGVLDYLGELMLYDEVTIGGKTYFMLNGGISGFNKETDPEEYEPADFAAAKLDMNKEYYSDKMMITANAEQGVYDKITQRKNNICIGCERCACLRLEDGETFYA